MGLFIIENANYILSGTCILFFIASLFGKISPRNVLGLIVLSFGISLVNVTKSIPKIKDHQIQVPQDSIGVFPKDTLENIEKEGGQDKQEENQMPERPNRDSLEWIIIIPDDYEVVDSNLWHYKTEGNWKWDKTFIEEIKKRTAWNKKKNGNYIISIEFQENFKSPIYEEGRRKFQYTGGEIDIKINGKFCCCKSILSIPSDISGSSYKNVKQNIQTEVTSILLKNKEIVIDKIKNCLRGEYL